MSYVDNSTLRTCDGPGCPASFDVAAPIEPADRLLAAAAGPWSQHASFGLHMCPACGPRYWGGDGPHVPRLEPEETYRAVCSCGNEVDGNTLGEMRTAYLTHLKELA